ncbi:hypothetical protein GIB67_026956 [Kingdonia uniflora]|uniref:Stigma-specific STIG1-like protein 1 n=1 Tax=Kingdonia uniflora TaxID=39325 RepID=A0A7J7P1G0_9MAGN|nr:hypothetical protein GIB67_026956 [Kingdonia uniflora]
MKVMKIVLLIITVIMAISFALTITIPKTEILEEEKAVKAITITTAKIDGEEEKPVKATDNLKELTPVKRVSRFLVHENPREKYHCNKNYSVCKAEGSPGSTCCNNKCIDLKTDKNNCGACKKKCKYTEACCRGQRVNLTFDKRHCGKCGNKCAPGGYCIYGMCDYA